jgi:hypothetical protein
MSGPAAPLSDPLNQPGSSSTQAPLSSQPCHIFYTLPFSASANETVEVELRQSAAPLEDLFDEEIVVNTTASDLSTMFRATREGGANTDAIFTFDPTTISTTAPALASKIALVEGEPSSDVSGKWLALNPDYQVNLTFADNSSPAVAKPTLQSWFSSTLTGWAISAGSDIYTAIMSGSVENVTGTTCKTLARRSADAPPLKLVEVLTAGGAKSGAVTNSSDQLSNMFLMLQAAGRLGANGLTPALVTGDSLTVYVEYDLIKTFKYVPLNGESFSVTINGTTVSIPDSTSASDGVAAYTGGKGASGKLRVKWIFKASE